MSTPTQSSVHNRLLSVMTPASFAGLRPHLEEVDLPLRLSLVEADQPTSHVCFIEHGLASTVAVSLDEEQIEVGHIGQEGMSGAHVVLHTDRTPNATFIQVAGHGLQMEVARFGEALAEDPALRNLLLRYIHFTEIQLAHSALANGRYSIIERLARWLLMCHDRNDGDDLLLTHDFLSLMLGVRRSGVTNELHIIEGVGAIKGTRGQIRVRDRAKLEEIAGGCYGLPEREYARLIGPLTR